MEMINPWQERMQIFERQRRQSRFTWMHIIHEINIGALINVIGILIIHLNIKYMRINSLHFDGTEKNVAFICIHSCIQMLKSNILLVEISSLFQNQSVYCLIFMASLLQSDHKHTVLHLKYIIVAPNPLSIAYKLKKALMMQTDKSEKVSVYLADAEGYNISSQLNLFVPRETEHERQRLGSMIESILHHPCLISGEGVEFVNI